MVDKFSIARFFKTLRVIEMADFVAVKIEDKDKYYVYKDRWENRCGGYYITKDEYKEKISSFERPIILSDIYITAND